MGTVASSASILDYEKPPEVINERELKRNLSLSTINEERSSQMYETANSDVTTNDKSEVSFSFDGKEVSVSLYETPDLTEEEAIQIVEMYAEQISEHVSENNVVALPPLRFVKETSHSGNLLMEAVLVDVSPEYFSQETGQETEADVENISSIIDDRATVDVSELSTDSSGRQRGSKKDKGENFVSADASKVSESGDQTTEADLQTFASAVSSDGKRASESPEQELEKDPDTSASKFVTPPIGFDTDAMIANNLASVLPLAREFTIALKHMKVIEEEVEMQSALLMSPTSADGSRKIVQNLIEPLTNIAKQLQSYNGETTLDEFFTTVIDDIESLHQGLTVVEKCVAMDQSGQTMVQRTSVCVIDSAGDLFLSAFNILNGIAHQYEDTTIGRKLCVLTHDLRYGITITQDTIKAQAVIQEANEFAQNAHLTESIVRLQQVQETVPFETISSADLPTEALNFKNMCRAVVHIQQVLDEAQEKSSTEILQEIIAPISDLEREVRIVENKLNNFKGEPTWEQKMINSILDSVTPPMYEMFKVLENFDRAPSEQASPLVEAILPPLQEIQSGLARIGQDIETETTEGYEDADTKRVLTSLTQTLIYFGSNISALSKESQASVTLRSIHTDLTELTRDITQQSLRRGQLTALENIRKNIEDLNYCFRQMEESTRRESCSDLIEPLSVLRETIEMSEYSLGIGSPDLQKRLLDDLDYSIACIEDNVAPTKVQEGDISQITIDSESELKSLRIENREVEHLIATLEHLHRCIAAIEEQEFYGNAEGAAGGQATTTPSPLEPIQNCLLNIKEAVTAVGNQQVVPRSADLTIITKIIEPLERIQDSLSVFETEEAAKSMSSQGNVSEIKTLAQPLHEMRECIGALQHDLSLDEYVEELGNLDVVNLARPVLELKRNIDALLHDVIESPHASHAVNHENTGSTYEFNLKRVEYGSILSTLRQSISTSQESNITTSEDARYLSQNLITEIDEILCKIEEPEYDSVSHSSHESFIRQLDVLESILRQAKPTHTLVITITLKSTELKALLGVAPTSAEQQSSPTVHHLKESILAIPHLESIVRASSVQNLSQPQIALIENQLSELKNIARHTLGEVTQEHVANVLQSVAQPLLKAYIGLISDAATLENLNLVEDEYGSDVEPDAQLVHLVEAVGVDNMVHMIHVSEVADRLVSEIVDEISNAGVDSDVIDRTKYVSLLSTIRNCVVSCVSNDPHMSENYSFLSDSLVAEIDDLLLRVDNIQHQSIDSSRHRLLLSQLDVIEIILNETSSDNPIVNELTSHTNELKDFLNIERSESSDGTDPVANFKERISHVQFPESISKCFAIQQLSPPQITFIEHQIDELQSVARNSRGILTKENMAIVLQPIAQPLLEAYLHVMSDKATFESISDDESSVASGGRPQPEAQLVQLVEAIGLNHIVHLSHITEQADRSFGDAGRGGDSNLNKIRYASLLLNIKECVLDCDPSKAIVKDIDSSLCRAVVSEIDNLLAKSEQPEHEAIQSGANRPLLSQLEFVEAIANESNPSHPVVLTLASHVADLKALLTTVDDTETTPDNLRQKISSISNQALSQCFAVQQLLQPQIAIIQNQIDELQNAARTRGTITKEDAALVLQPIARPLVEAYINILSDRATLESVSAVTEEVSLNNQRPEAQLIQLLEAVGIQNIVHVSGICEQAHRATVTHAEPVEDNLTKIRYASLLMNIRECVLSCSSNNATASESTTALCQALVSEIDGLISKAEHPEHRVLDQSTNRSIVNQLDMYEIILRETNVHDSAVANLFSHVNDLRDLLHIERPTISVSSLQRNIASVQHPESISNCFTIQRLAQPQIAFIQHQIGELQSVVKSSRGTITKEMVAVVLQPIAQPLLEAYIYALSDRATLDVLNESDSESSDITEREVSPEVQLVQLVEAVGVENLVQMTSEGDGAQSAKEKLNRVIYASLLINIKESIARCSAINNVITNENSAILSQSLITLIDDLINKSESTEFNPLEGNSNAILLSQLDVFEIVLREANSTNPIVSTLIAHINDLRGLLNVPKSQEPIIPKYKEKISAVAHPDNISNYHAIQRLPQPQIAFIQHQIAELQSAVRNSRGEISKEQIAVVIQPIAEPLLRAYICSLAERATLERVASSDNESNESPAVEESAAQLAQLIKAVGVEEIVHMAHLSEQSSMEIDPDQPIATSSDTKEEDVDRTKYLSTLLEIKQCIVDCHSNQLIVTDNSAILSQCLTAEIDEILNALPEPQTAVVVDESVQQTLVNQLEVLDVLVREANPDLTAITPLTAKTEELKHILHVAQVEPSKLKLHNLSEHPAEIIAKHSAIQNLPQSQITLIENQINELQNILKNEHESLTKEQIANVLQPIAQPLLNAYVQVLSQSGSISHVAPQEDQPANEFEEQSSNEILQLVQAVGVEEIARMANEEGKPAVVDSEKNELVQSLQEVWQCIVDCNSTEIVVTENAAILHQGLLNEIDSLQTSIEEGKVETLSPSLRQVVLSQLEAFEVIMKETNVYAPPVTALTSQIECLKAVLGVTPDETDDRTVKDRILAIQHPEIISHCLAVQQLPTSQIAIIDNQIHELQDNARSAIDVDAIRQEIAMILQPVAQPILKAYISILSERATAECGQAPAAEQSTTETDLNTQSASQLVQLVDAIGVEELIQMAYKTDMNQDQEMGSKESVVSDRLEYASVLSDIKECIVNCRSNEIIMNENAATLSQSLAHEIDEILTNLESSNHDVIAESPVNKQLLRQLEVFEIIMIETNVFAPPVITLAAKIKELKALLNVPVDDTSSIASSDISSLRERIQLVQNPESISKYFAIQRLPQAQIAFIENQLLALQEVARNAQGDLAKEEIAVVLQPIAQPLLLAYICLLTDRASLEEALDQTGADTSNEHQPAAELINLVEAVGVGELVQLALASQATRTSSSPEMPPVPTYVKLRRLLLCAQQNSFHDKLEELVALREFAELKPFGERISEVRNIVATNPLSEFEQLEEDRELDESANLVRIIAKPLFEIKKFAQSMEGQDAIFVCAGNLIEYGHKKTYESLVDLVHCIEEIPLEEFVDVSTLVEQVETIEISSDVAATTDEVTTEQPIAVAEEHKQAADQGDQEATDNQVTEIETDIAEVGSDVAATTDEVTTEQTIAVAEERKEAANQVDQEATDDQVTEIETDIEDQLVSLISDTKAESMITTIDNEAPTLDSLRGITSDTDFAIIESDTASQATEMDESQYSMDTVLADTIDEPSQVESITADTVVDVEELSVASSDLITVAEASLSSESDARADTTADVKATEAMELDSGLEEKTEVEQHGTVVVDADVVMSDATDINVTTDLSKSAVEDVVTMETSLDTSQATVQEIGNEVLDSSEASSLTLEPDELVIDLREEIQASTDSKEQTATIESGSSSIEQSREEDSSPTYEQPVEEIEILEVNIS